MSFHLQDFTQGRSDELFEALPSRPSSPFPRSQSFMSQSPTASTFFLGDTLSGNNSTATLLPRALGLASLRRSSSSSTYSVSLDDRTACPTPQPELDLADLRQYEEKNSFRKIPLGVTSFEKRLDSRSYIVETVHKHDDVELLSTWRRRLYRLSPLFTFAAVAAYFLYYIYRIHCTIVAQQAYKKVYIMAWIFIAAEGCVACEFVLTFEGPS